MQTRTTTRQTLSFLVLLITLLTGIISCKKDIHEGEDTPAPVVTRISEYKNGNEFIRFEYNTDGSVRKVTVKNELATDGNTIDYTISYNAAKKISAVQTSAGEKIVPVYENEVMTRSDIFEGSLRTGYANYQYADGLLKRTTLYWGEGTDFEPFFELIFSHDNAGNTTETVAMAATQQLGHLERMGNVVYKYDTKTNPLYIHKDLLVLLLQSASPNNVTQEDHFDVNLIPEDRYTYTYTYKTNGFPQQAQAKKGLPGQVPVTSQVDFIYK